VGALIGILIGAPPAAGKEAHPMNARNSAQRVAGSEARLLAMQADEHLRGPLGPEQSCTHSLALYASLPHGATGTPRRRWSGQCFPQPRRRKRCSTTRQPSPAPSNSSPEGSGRKNTVSLHNRAAVQMFTIGSAGSMGTL